MSGKVVYFPGNIPPRSERCLWSGSSAETSQEGEKCNYNTFEVFSRMGRFVAAFGPNPVGYSRTQQTSSRDDDRGFEDGTGVLKNKVLGLFELGIQKSILQY